MPGIIVPFPKIICPMKRLQVAQFMGPTKRHRFDVVDLPAIFGIRVAVIRESDDPTANVGTPEVRISTWNRLTLLPNRELCVKIDIFEWIGIDHIALSDVDAVLLHCLPQ